MVGGNGGRQCLTAVMDKGWHWRLTVAMDDSWQQWTIETVFNGGSGGLCENEEDN